MDEQTRDRIAKLSPDNKYRLRRAVERVELSGIRGAEWNKVNWGAILDEIEGVHKPTPQQSLEDYLDTVAEMGGLEGLEEMQAEWEDAKSAGAARMVVAAPGSNIIGQHLLYYDVDGNLIGLPTTHRNEFMRKQREAFLQREREAGATSLG